MTQKNWNVTPRSGPDSGIKHLDIPSAFFGVGGGGCVSAEHERWRAKRLMYVTLATPYERLGDVCCACQDATTLPRQALELTCNI